jgi:hypothetical protein
MLQGLFIKNNSSAASMQPAELPVAPPLPEFLTCATSQQQLTLKSVKASDSLTSGFQQKIIDQKNDLHEKLIKEIHNKSLERSRKDQSFCLDERGNLINRPLANTHRNAASGHRMFKIKDQSFSHNNNNNNYNNNNNQQQQQQQIITDKITQLIHKQYLSNNSNNDFQDSNSKQLTSFYPPYLLKQREINSELLEKYNIQQTSSSFREQPDAVMNENEGSVCWVSTLFRVGCSSISKL